MGQWCAQVCLGEVPPDECQQADKVLQQKDQEFQATSEQLQGLQDSNAALSSKLQELQASYGTFFPRIQHAICFIDRNVANTGTLLHKILIQWFVHLKHAHASLPSKQCHVLLQTAWCKKETRGRKR